MLGCLKDPGKKSPAPLPGIGFCEEKNRLQNNFLQAIRNYNILLEQQTGAVISGDEDFNRFDILLHAAQDEKERAKYLWMMHVDSHGC
jgi:hypothetical protein